MRTLKEACKDLIFVAEVIDSSETPTTADINELHDCIAECREIIKQD